MYADISIPLPTIRPVTQPILAKPAPPPIVAQSMLNIVWVDVSWIVEERRFQVRIYDEESCEAHPNAIVVYILYGADLTQVTQRLEAAWTKTYQTLHYSCREPHYRVYDFTNGMPVVLKILDNLQREFRP